MIISASRRTDIPAFYGEWFINRFRAGYVHVRNPFNPRQIRMISLAPKDVDCIVFWTKNPSPLKPILHELDAASVPYYFLFTVTPYGRDIERHVPSIDEALNNFRSLSGSIGPERVHWRYDPIFFTGSIDEKFHICRFEEISKALTGATEKCIISFLHLYRKCRHNLAKVQPIEMKFSRKVQVARTLADIASKYGISLEWCAPEENTARFGITRGGCVDISLIQKLAGRPVAAGKDPGQRKECGCAKSADIGAYNTCPHGCLYCYANSNCETAERNRRSHDPLYPCLAGAVHEGPGEQRTLFE